MTETIQLPAEIADREACIEINQRARRGEIALDWSRVERATTSALTALLSGLDLAADADVIGLETIPDALQTEVARAIDESSARTQAVESVADPGRDEDSDSPSANGAEGDSADPASGSSEPSVAPRVLVRKSGFEIRKEIVSLAMSDLVGPVGGPDEEVAEPRVRDRYLVGLLAPRGFALHAEEADGLAQEGGSDDEDGAADGQPAARSTMFPSSMGISFTVARECPSIVVSARWGHYERTESRTLVDSKTGAYRRVWKRQQIEGTSKPIKLVEGELNELKAWQIDDGQPEVRVEGLARRSPHGEWIVTLFLVNGGAEPSRNRDQAWLFQAGLSVGAPGGEAIFVRNALHSLEAFGPSDVDPDDRELEMLYRNHVEFAVGHGVGAHWETAESDPTRATRISTVAVPEHEVWQTTVPNPEEVAGLDAAAFDMARIADAEGEALTASLLPIVDVYDRWIADRAADAAGGKDGLAAYRDEAKRVIERCRRVSSRIRAGIDLLSKDSRAAEAFRFANRAMTRQRVRSRFALAKRRGAPQPLETFDVPANRTWRPFQLAFILLNLPSVTDPHHADRSDVDSAVAELLWFPTGGGKTEAYLGLAAYVLALRRLQGNIGGRDGENGVAVLMRYTLRLLTVQQFQRAAALLCACESIRREALDKGDRRWGATPFRIGLWVGSRVTPNSTEQSHEAVRQLAGNSYSGVLGSPHQLVHCPWCGSKIDPGRDLRVDQMPGGYGRTIVYCGDTLGRCLFSARLAKDEGLPVIVVDEEIYRHLPGLVIATVDKFAQMPWNGAVQTLFGTVDGRCARHGYRWPDSDDARSHPKTEDGKPAAKSSEVLPPRPPDLIIQDELHLISGPLGTMVALYETAVDEMCTWQLDGKSVRPKVIASTATVRRARHQVKLVFRRQLEIFPPSGLDIRDNFFSVRRRPSEQFPGRLYLGICAQGRRVKAAAIRAYVTFMAAAQTLYAQCGGRADPWMTTVGYHNSMRELGGMRRLVDDTVASALRRIGSRGLTPRTIHPTAVEELTSRKSSADIPDVLDHLEVEFDPEVEAQRMEAIRAGQKPKGRRPLDVVLATNMISVGVDVDRLGLMIVGGQPKTTAEYIQATSRVGRRHPGIVIVLFNWSRPRDLSHYEQFEHYHATFYRHVEALSVTPFAPRALDRGLFGVLASMVRLRERKFNPNGEARRVRSTESVAKVAISALRSRAHSVTHDAGSAELVRQIAESRIDEWAHFAAQTTDANPLGYRESNATRGLLMRPGEGKWGIFTCPMSLRDVEPTVNLVLTEGQLDDGPPFRGRPASAKKNPRGGRRS